MRRSLADLDQKARFAAEVVTDQMLVGGANKRRINIGEAPKDFTETETRDLVGTRVISILQGENSVVDVVYNPEQSAQDTDEFERLVAGQELPPVEKGIRVVFTRAVEAN